jgi:hypothetical protein
MSQFETNQQLAKCGLSSQDLSVRSPFDQSYLQQYNTLAQNAQTYPSDNVKNMPRLSPYHDSPYMNYPGSKEGYHLGNTQKGNYPPPGAECNTCKKIPTLEEEEYCTNLCSQYMPQELQYLTAYPQSWDKCWDDCCNTLPGQRPCPSGAPRSDHFGPLDCHGLSCPPRQGLKKDSPYMNYPGSKEGYHKQLGVCNPGWIDGAPINVPPSGCAGCPLKSDGSCCLLCGNSQCCCVPATSC